MADAAGDDTQRPLEKAECRRLAALYRPDYRGGIRRRLVGANYAR